MSEQKGFFDSNPKFIFLFGLVAGVAITMVFSGGISLPAANSGTGTVVRAFDADDTQDDSALPTTLALITTDDHVKGSIEDAKVVIVEYSDFECPYCSSHHPTLQKVVDTYGDDVAWVYRHFPLSFHPEAQSSALASECAAEQGKFWEFADAMFIGQENLGDSLYTNTAKSLGLNMNKFTDCYESEKYAEKVDGDLASGGIAGVTGTPGTFVNGQLVSGAVPFATFSGVIDGLLSE